MRTNLIGRRRFLAAGAAAGSLMIARAQAALALTKADIVLTQGVSGLVVQEVTRAQGYFAEFGIDPNILLVSDGAKSIAALLGGSGVICMWSGFNQLTPALEKGAKLKILAGSLSHPTLAFYSGRDNIHQVSDLAGKTIGIGALGSVLHQMTVLLLRKKGVDPNKVTFRNVGSNADIFQAIVNKTIDAGPADLDAFDQQQKYGIHVLSDGVLWKEIPEYTNQASYASDVAIQQNRDLLVRILAAYAKGYRYVSSPQSRQAFIDARKKVTGDADPTAAITNWNWIQQAQPYAVNLLLTSQQIDFVQKLNVEFGVQKQVLPVDEIADMSLARDALKLIG